MLLEKGTCNIEKGTYSVHSKVFFLNVQCRYFQRKANINGKDVYFIIKNLSNFIYFEI